MVLLASPQVVRHVQGQTLFGRLDFILPVGCIRIDDCACPNCCMLPQDGIYDEFTKAVTEKVKKLKQGPGLDPSSTLGPLINTAAVERVRTIPLNSLFTLYGCDEVYCE